jgi:repressor LexA
MDKLTRRQSQVVLFVRRYADKFGFPPSRREIADKFGVSVNAITGHIAAAERKGAISRSANTARGLVVHEATDRKANPRGASYATSK